jgi:hypothetical protein
MKLADEGVEDLKGLPQQGLGGEQGWREACRALESRYIIPCAPTPARAAGEHPAARRSGGAGGARRGGARGGGGGADGGAQPGGSRGAGGGGAREPDCGEPGAAEAA